ncbi:conserved Plasmodium protein, unknown function [Plasmodium yoelii]|uniref:Uncharacterized protein n=2 Tax=Plasmodium yoelii TaxID=5861 RepID=A0AAE9WMS1_PLAYO|nr:conserved Plasmodium protein, unknown function [Plasmodium yoelii]WBY56917.1 hypothetical protein Py17XNL_000801912 [Plasmodium yoelii yoelii]VTZ77708.1 conserved Plasmodium protein, unknown function [Plasmodium yoelii]|eukprot:XP_728194.3 conserved Plasmodium protein, unknown function [Plasmodium yoelii]
MKVTFSLFFILVVATKLNLNVYCSKDYINESNEIKYNPFTFDLSSYDLDSQNNFLINLKHDEPKQNLRKKRNENSLEYSEENNYNTEEYMTKHNDVNDNISHEQSEYETTDEKYPQQYSSDYETYVTPNLNENESSSDTKLENEVFETSPIPYDNNANAEKGYDNLDAESNNEYTSESNYNTEHIDVNDTESKGINEVYENKPDLDENIAKDLDENIAKDLDENIAKDLDENVAKDLDENIAKDLDENVAKDLDENIAKDLDENVAKDLDENVTNDLDENKEVNEVEENKEVNESIKKNVDIRNIFVKGIDLCKDIFDFRNNKSTFKYENNGDKKGISEESENSENNQITIDTTNNTDSKSVISKVYVIDNTIEQYMKDIYSILINIQNTIEKSKTIVE